MKYLGHLVAADVRRYPLLLASSVTVTIASTVVAGLTPSLPLDPTTRAIAGLLGELCWIASVVLTIMAVALIVQIHPLVGSDAFWPTRPIPALSLLAGKLMVLSVVVVLVPALAEVGLMWAYGVPWRIMAQVFAQGLPFSFFLLMLLMSAAAITSSLPRYMLLLAGGVGSVAVALGVLIAVMMSRMEDEGIFVATGAREDPTGGMVMMVILVAAGVALLRAQYMSRSRIRAVGIGIAGMCTAVLIGNYWPWPLLQPIEAAPRWANEPSSAQLRDHSRFAAIGYVVGNPFAPRVAGAVSRRDDQRARARLVGSDRALAGVSRNRNARRADVRARDERAAPDRKRSGCI